MNERIIRSYFRKKYGYTLYDTDNIDLVSDPDDQILACDLALERIGRIEREFVRSGKMTTEQRLDVVEEQLNALTARVGKLWGIALMDRETEMNRRGQN